MIFYVFDKYSEDNFETLLLVGNYTPQFLNKANEVLTIIRLGSFHNDSYPTLVKCESKLRFF